MGQRLLSCTLFYLLLSLAFFQPAASAADSQRQELWRLREKIIAFPSGDFHDSQCEMLLLPIYPSRTEGLPAYDKYIYYLEREVERLVTPEYALLINNYKNQVSELGCYGVRNSRRYHDESPKVTCCEELEEQFRQAFVEPFQAKVLASAVDYLKRFVDLQALGHVPELADFFSSEIITYDDYLAVTTYTLNPWIYEQAGFGRSNILYDKSFPAKLGWSYSGKVRIQQELRIAVQADVGDVRLTFALDRKEWFSGDDKWLEENQPDQSEKKEFYVGRVMYDGAFFLDQLAEGRETWDWNIGGPQWGCTLVPGAGMLSYEQRELCQNLHQSLIATEREWDTIPDQKEKERRLKDLMQQLTAVETAFGLESSPR